MDNLTMDNLNNLRSISQSIPRSEYLRVKNYRALCDLELKGITPLTVFLGPNGSGKSTIFDVFAFLSECFTSGLRRAWDRRGRFKKLQTREQEGPIVIELRYRESPKLPLITYHLAIDERFKGPKCPFMAEEWLRWKWSQRGNGAVVENHSAFGHFLSVLKRKILE